MYGTRARLAAIAIAMAPALLAPPTAASVELPPDPTGLLASDNVSLVTTLAEPGVIGANFRDGFMFVTTVSGVIVYDVSDPMAPVEVGRLALPHFENEDVDLGGDILLVSNDAAESYGLLHVIDISDPTNPTLRSTYDTGNDAVTTQFFGGPAHTTSCINDCTFAWMTDAGGYRIIDLRDPDNPVSLGKQPSPAGGSLGITHDMQVDEDNIAWTVGFGGTAAFQIPDDYAGEVLTPFASTADDAQSGYAQTFGLDDGSGVNDYIHHNSMRLLNSDTLYVTEEDYNRPGCRGAGSFQRWHVPSLETGHPGNGQGHIKGSGKGHLDDGGLVPTGDDLVFQDLWVTELLADTASPAAVCSAHYFDIRDGLVAQGWYEQGLRLLDVTGDEIRQVGFWVPPTAATWAAYFPPTDATGTVVYALDATHGIDVLSIDLGTAGVAGAPTVVAPIRDAWRTVAPATSPGVFGFACRLSPALALATDTSLG